MALPVTMHRCNDGRSILLESVSAEGSGVLLRLRYRDSLMADSVPLVVPSDTAAVPAASVAIRYYVHETPRSVVLDSGFARVNRDGPTVGAQVRGAGLENAIRTPATLEYRGVPIGADTVPCNFVP